jgi:hypothetical protein
VLVPLEAELAKVRALNINDASYEWRAFLDEINALVNEIATK